MAKKRYSFLLVLSGDSLEFESEYWKLTGPIENINSLFAQTELYSYLSGYGLLS